MSKPGENLPIESVILDYDHGWTKNSHTGEINSSLIITNINSPLKINIEKSSKERKGRTNIENKLVTLKKPKSQHSMESHSGGNN